MLAPRPSAYHGRGMTSAPPLLVTRDEMLLDELLRLAAAAGVTLDVAADTMSAMRGWAPAALVLVGADQAGDVAEQRPPRRDGVHVVGHGPVDDRVFRSALAAGALDVVELPASQAWLVELLTDVSDGARGGRRRRARTFAVISGSGGAGATTFAAGLAVVSARLRTSALVDLDPLGPGLDRVVGLDGSEGVRWDGLVTTPGRLGSRSLREALPEKDGLVVLTWDVATPVDLDPGSVREVLSASQRGNELVVVDLPRALDDVTVEVVTRCDRVLVVVTPTIMGVASAAKVLAGLRTATDRIGLVVRRRGTAIDSEQVAATLGVPLLAELPRQRRLAEHLELGLGPAHGPRSPLARSARAALLELIEAEHAEDAA
jgi:secretion/DNA translocation related CpaE-like protein